MSQLKKIVTPLDNKAVLDLHAGDEALISGVVYSARDQAHKRLCEQIAAGKPLPFNLDGAMIYYMGPTPAAPGRVIGSAGPTTSMRMDAFAPVLFEHGLKATIGKGYRGRQVQESLVKFKAVHFSAMGGFGALLSEHITASEIIAYDDLGPEAIRRLVFEQFPAIVAYDSYGKTVY